MTPSSTGFNGVRLIDENGRNLVTYDSKVIKITSAQLLALNATPITLVPALANESGKMFEFLSAAVHKPAGTAYAGIAAGEDLAIKYTDASGAQVNTSLETTGFLDQATAQTRITKPIVTEVVPVLDTPLVLHLLAGEITTGDSDLYVTVNYLTHESPTSEPR